MPLVFSTSSVVTFWAYSCLERFLWGGLIGLEWSSFRSSLQVSRKCCLEPVRVYFNPMAFFGHSQLNFNIIYPFGFLLWYFRSHILLQNLFASLASGCWIWLRLLFPWLLVEFFSLFWDVLFVSTVWSCLDIFLVFVLPPVFLFGLLKLFFEF